MMKLDALVGYAWCRSSYAAVRNLARNGVRVGTLDTSRIGMGQFSRYSLRHFRHPDPYLDPEGFIQRLGEIITKHDVRFYLPGHDEGEVVAQHRHRLPEHVIVPLVDKELLDLANNKSATLELALQLGVPAPRTFEWTEPADLSGCLTSAPAGYVIKLLRGNGAKGVFYADTPTGLRKQVERLVSEFALRPERYPLVQERVAGEGWGVSCLYWRGNRIAHFTHQRLREKTQTGGTSTLRAAATDPAMEAAAFTMLDELNWHGLAMVEFKRDPKTGAFWFIEINPRLWGSIALPIAAGVEFPYLCYLAATESAEVATGSVGQPVTELVARWYLGEVIISVQHLSKFRVAAAFRQLGPADADVYDDLLRDDMKATLGEFMSYFARFLSSFSTNPTDRGVLE